LGFGQDVPARVVKSARVIRRYVACLVALQEAEKQRTGASRSSVAILMATVKGDVHDIG
jgi:5-methyltetrahydrofolate--homocysteine methyltransferase